MPRPCQNPIFFMYEAELSPYSTGVCKKKRYIYRGKRINKKERRPKAKGRSKSKQKAKGHLGRVPEG